MRPHDFEEGSKKPTAASKTPSPFMVALAPRIRELKFYIHLMTKSATSIAGVALIAFLVFLAAFPFLFAAARVVDPYVIPKDWYEPDPQAPSLDGYLFGSGENGQDIYYGIVWGARISMSFAIQIVGISVIIGTVFGLVSGYKGGAIDEVMMRTTDIFLSIPSLILVMAIAAVMGRDLNSTKLALLAIWWAGYTRLVRGQVLSIKENTYVDAARASGSGELKIMFRHILPNSWAPVRRLGHDGHGHGRAGHGRAQLPRARCPVRIRRVGRHDPGGTGALRRRRLVDDRLPGPRDPDVRAGVQPHGRRTQGHTRPEDEEVNRWRMTTLLVEIDNLYVNFYTYQGVVKAIDGIDLEIKNGETLGIVGETGCGKSVTASTIMKLILSPPGKIESGAIYFMEPPDVRAARKQAELDAQTWYENLPPGERAKVVAEYGIRFTGFKKDRKALRSDGTVQAVPNRIPTGVLAAHFRKKLEKVPKDDKVMQEAIGQKYDLLPKSNEYMQLIRGRFISMIFQEPTAALNPVFTAGDQIAEVILQHRKSDMAKRARLAVYREQWLMETGRIKKTLIRKGKMIDKKLDGQDPPAGLEAEADLPDADARDDREEPAYPRQHHGQDTAGPADTVLQPAQQGHLQPGHHRSHEDAATSSAYPTPRGS